MEETSQVEETKTAVVFKAVYVDDDGEADFTKIQEAIDYVAEGGTIFVRNGTYYEMLIIDKSINLIGTSKDKTIIDYKQGSIPSSDSVFFINADNCTVKGFKIICINNTSDIIGININSSNNTILNNIILYSYKGVFLDIYVKNNTISLNTISNAKHGISTFGSDSINISKNNISLCTLYGIYLYLSDNNIISDNMISDNDIGIRLQGSKDSKIIGNTIKNCSQGLRFCCGANNNLIYYNIFIQNHDWSAMDEVTNQWDNGNVGNYWDDYIDKNPDATSIDGIWDTPYNITSGRNMDRFPLVNP